MANDAYTVRLAADFTPSDLETLYAQAFPEEDLMPLLHDLRGEPETVITLLAENGNALIGHACLTLCRIAPDDMSAALLGPVAVSPDYQKSGVGTGLIRRGLEELERAGVPQVFVLGDPAFYSRFGFSQERIVSPPYAIPEEWKPAWQSLVFDPDEKYAGQNEVADDSDGGPILTVPDSWNKQALWSS